jgi:protein-S-isoprenylcysteine O-methyltransferase Ste14
MPDTRDSRRTDDVPGVIAPPPVLFGVALVIGLAADLLLLHIPTGLPVLARYGVGAFLVVAAVGLVTAAFLQFRRSGTPAEPWRPTTTIVTVGVYAYTRNPMYLAMTLAYIGIAIAADSVIALLLLVPLLIVLYYGVILREERYLEAKFGQDYRRYRHRVRRWI